MDEVKKLPIRLIAQLGQGLCVEVNQTSAGKRRMAGEPLAA